jgi:hypothetical protein
MLRSVVPTFSIITTRIWAAILSFALSPVRDNVFGDDYALFGWVLAGLKGWLGWTIPLLVLECVLRVKGTRRFPQMIPN